MLPNSPFDKRVVFTSLHHSSSELFEPTPAELSIAPRGASALRRIEFILGRRAVSEGLKTLGLPDAPPLLRVGRLPVWPPGVRGSVSHTHIGGQIRAVAAVTIDSEIAALGVDIEGIRPISARVLQRIAQPAELDWVRSGDSARRAIAVFAAREALFKALSPVYGHPMLYRETHLAWSEEENGFRAVTELPRLHRAPVESVVRIIYRDSDVLAGTVILRGL